MNGMPVSIKVTRLILEPAFGELTERVYAIFQKFGSRYSNVIAHHLFTALGQVESENKVMEVLNIFEHYCDDHDPLTQDCDEGLLAMFSESRAVINPVLA